MIGATMIESAERGAVTVRSAIEMLSAAYALHPAFGEAEIVEMSADVRPAFPDNEPRIEERSGRIYRQRFLPSRLSAGAGLRRRAATLGVRAGRGARMTLIVNGDRDVEAATLASALEALDYGEATVATALNGEFVPAGARGDAGEGGRPDRDRRATAGGIGRWRAMQKAVIASERSREAIHGKVRRPWPLDCFASLAMTAIGQRIGT